MMRSSLRRTISPSTVIALVALVFSIGGTSYALSSLPAKSVGTRELKNRAVTTAKLANSAVVAQNVKAGAITAAKIGGGAVTGVQIKAGAVTGDKVAAGAVTGDKVAADSITGAQVNESTLSEVPAAGIAGLTIAQHTYSVGAGLVGNATMSCPAGTVSIGGGASVPHTFNSFIIDSHPNGSSWEVSVANNGAAPEDVTFSAVCARPAPGTGTATAASVRRATHIVFTTLHGGR
jgi:hypothetical protein